MWALMTEEELTPVEDPLVVSSSYSLVGPPNQVQPSSQRTMVREDKPISRFLPSCSTLGGMDISGWRGWKSEVR